MSESSSSTTMRLDEYIGMIGLAYKADRDWVKSKLMRTKASRESVQSHWFANSLKNDYLYNAPVWEQPCFTLEQFLYYNWNLAYKGVETDPLERNVSFVLENLYSSLGLVRDVTTCTGEFDGFPLYGEVTIQHQLRYIYPAYRGYCKDGIEKPVGFLSIYGGYASYNEVGTKFKGLPETLKTDTQVVSEQGIVDVLEGDCIKGIGDTVTEMATSALTAAGFTATEVDGKLTVGITNKVDNHTLSKVAPHLQGGMTVLSGGEIYKFTFSNGGYTVENHHGEVVTFEDVVPKHNTSVQLTLCF